MLCILARGCGEVWARSGPGLVLRTGQTGSIFPANTILEAAGEMGFGKAFGEGSSRQSFGFCFAFFFGGRFGLLVSVPADTPLSWQTRVLLNPRRGERKQW